MPRDKKKQKVADFSTPKLHPIWDIPSQSCKDFLMELIVRFYEQNSVPALESKYMRYRHEGPYKFKIEMSQLMIDALQSPKWIVETHKRRFMNFLNSRVHDALWNSNNLLAKYGREYRGCDEAFNLVVLKVDLFVAQMKPFAKNKNWHGFVGWWNFEEERHGEHARMAHLIAIPAMARVIAVDNILWRGGYAIIQRIHIEGAFGIKSFWEFAIKLSKQSQSRLDLAIMEDQNESMAVRILHSGITRFVAIHASKYEGYAYYWNGRTIREMLNRDLEYDEDVYIHLLYGNFSNDEIIRAHQLVQFCKKRTELVWALL